jgi:hypothetical protein
MIALSCRHPSGERFVLSAEHAACLTPAVTADNMAVFTHYSVGLGGVEDDIVECLKQGGWVPYGKYPSFHEVMAEDSGQSVLSLLESRILPLVPGSTGRLARATCVLDAGSGRGRIMTRLADGIPWSLPTGTDDQASMCWLTNAEEAGDAFAVRSMLAV